MYRHTIQINQSTRCNNFSSLLLDVYVQLNMFRGPHTHHQELKCSRSLWFYGWSVVVAVLLVVVGLAGHCNEFWVLTQSS